LSWSLSVLADKGAELRAWLIALAPDFLRDLIAAAPLWAIGVVAALAAALLWGGLAYVARLVGGRDDVDDPVPASSAPRSAVRAPLQVDRRSSKMLPKVLARLDRLDVDGILAGATPLDAAERERRNAAAAEIVADASPAANAAAREIVAGKIAGAYAILERDARNAYADAADRWRRLGALVLGTDTAKAVAAYEEAFRLQPDDFWTCIELARLRSIAGDLRGAHQAAFAAELAARSERETSVALNALGNVLMDDGDAAGAKARYEASLRIRERLAARDRRNPAPQRDLAAAFVKLGDVLVRADEVDEAKACYEAGLRIRERLAAKDRRNPDAQRDLSISLTKLGLVAERAGDLAGAKARYEASLRIAERLAAESRGSVQAQRDLSSNLDKLGYVLLKAGDSAGARRRYEASQRISQTTRKEEPRSDWLAALRT
jgi:tetratricopeptide (TPR) repeat protein